MKVQIYSHKTAEEARKTAECGAEFIGFSVGEKGRLSAEVNFATGREIVAALPADSMTVALTIAWELPEIIETVKAVNPNVIHLSGEIDDLPPEGVAELRQAIQPVKILQAIPVGSPETRERALRLARAYRHVSDYFIIDTDHSSFIGIGATGLLHDWSISAEIVRVVNIPVILAGGLKAENVAEAIRAVKPWGVDSFTHTNLPDSKLKDHDRVRAFVQAAKSAL